MAAAVASRFAVLSVDCEDDSPRHCRQKKTTGKKPSQGAQKLDPNQKKKNKKAENVKQQQQNKCSKTKSKTKASAQGNGVKKGSAAYRKKPVEVNQWDEWKEEDSEFVEVSYDRDLHQALLLSKLDYEEKKGTCEQLRTESLGQEKQPGSHSGSKQSKKQQHCQQQSLEEFNSIDESDGLNGVFDNPGTENDRPLVNVLDQIQSDAKFFEEIQRDVKKFLAHEQSEGLRKSLDPFAQEGLLVTQLQDILLKKMKENKQLMLEVVQLKEELTNARIRNKKLCQILAEGEMKDKAQVLLEVNRLQQMRDELSSEVFSLHTLLEQERSKVRALTFEVKKSQNKKRTASETAQ